MTKHQMRRLYWASLLFWVAVISGMVVDMLMR
jgi:hypothetical protein